MDNFSYYLPTISLIASIISILVGAQAVSKNIRDTGFFKSISSLVMIIVPIIFIQQVIILMDKYYIDLIEAFAFFTLITFIRTIIRREFNARITILLVALITSRFCYLMNASIMLSTKEFIYTLIQQKINFSMYEYLYENYSATIFAVLMLVQIVNLLICSIYFNLLEWGNKSDTLYHPNQTDYMRLTIGVVFALPFTYQGIQYIFSLFG